MEITQYPKTVQDWLDSVYEKLDVNGFFNENDIGKLKQSTIKICFMDVVGEYVLKYWLNTGDIEVPPKKMSHLLYKTVIKSGIEELKEEDTLDYIEDENGKEVVWVNNKDDENK